MFKGKKNNTEKDAQSEISVPVSENKKKSKFKKNKNDDVNKSPKKDYKGFSFGTKTEKDFLAPDSIDRSDESVLKIGSKYVRTSVVNGFPKRVKVGWLTELYEYDGDMDVALYIEPADERTALDELTGKITQYESQLLIEEQKGSIKHTSRLRNALHELYAQREKLELTYENMFYISIHNALYDSNKEDLEKNLQMLDSKTRGKKLNLLPLYLQQDEGYKSMLPFGQNFITDKYRNFNSGALTACFPFYNSQITHKNGILAGINLETYTPVLIDFYNKSIMNNHNLTVLGQSGSGKTAFVSMLTLRSIYKGIKTVIIDPEGEYEKLTLGVNGALIKIAPDSPTRVNPFDIEEEVERSGKVFVDIKTKVADVLNLIGVMVGGLNPEELSLVAGVISKLYTDRGFTSDPESLYEKDAMFDNKTNMFSHDKIKKTMPIFSDFHDELVKFAKEINSAQLVKLANSLNVFKKGNLYDMFDGHTSPELRDFKKAPVVTFDVSQLEENILRPIGMYVALSWTWEKFVKKNPFQKKRVVCDEAWMLVNPLMKGHEFTSEFLNRASRRMRKRNCGLLTASQQFMEFERNPQGKAVLNNAVVNIFLSQDSIDIDAVQKTFNLSDGERNFLLTSKRGEYLIKTKKESAVAFALIFDAEGELIFPDEKETK